MTQTKAELLQTRHQGDIRLGDADSTHYVGFKAPATVSSSLVWTLTAADGTANYLLKTDGSGNLGWVADSTTDSTKMPLAGGSFTGDVTFTGASSNIVFDKSDNALEFADNAKLKFGAELEIYSAGTASYIKDTGTGNLNFNVDNLIVASADDTATIAKFKEADACELYFNNALKLATKSTGVDITGNITSGSLTVDTNTLYVDASNDRVGINTTNPDNELEIQGATDPKLKIESQESGNKRLELWIDGGTAVGYIAANQSASSLQFQTTSTTALTISSSQNATFASAIYGPAKTVGALELDLSTGNYFIKTISGNSTFTFANPAASGTVTAFTLELTHSSGTVTWPSSVKWNADTAPTLSTGKTHLFMFVTDDGGSRYRGSALVDYVN